MLRPVPKAARYRMPVSGLFLCGAGAHPGGCVWGAPGQRAAAAVLSTTSTFWLTPARGVTVTVRVT